MSVTWALPANLTIRVGLSPTHPALPVPWGRAGFIPGDGDIRPGLFNKRKQWEGPEFYFKVAGTLDSESGRNTYCNIDRALFAPGGYVPDAGSNRPVGGD